MTSNSPVRCRSRRAKSCRLALAIVAGTVGASAAGAQTAYHGTDAGRPVRIEDASATERYGFALQLAPLRVERMLGGVYRWRTEPKLAYGVLPRTEIEVRLPLVYREQGALPRAGMAGLGVGALHNFNVESVHLPAVALSAEVLLPLGGAASGAPALSARALLTRTFGAGRLHLNALYGRYQLGSLQAFGRPGCGSGDAAVCDTTSPPIEDFPCAGRRRAPVAEVERVLPPQSGVAQVESSLAPDLPRTAVHWLAGVAADKTFAFRSLLLTGDVFAEYFGGLDRPVDWTAEVGARHQLTPRLVLDAGVGRRFAGRSQAWFLTFGTTYTFAVRFLVPDTP